MNSNANQGHVPDLVMNSNTTTKEFYWQLQALQQGQMNQQEVNNHLQTVLADITETINKLQNTNTFPPTSTPVSTQQPTPVPTATTGIPQTIPLLMSDLIPKQKIKWGEKDTYSDKKKTAYLSFKLLLKQKLTVDWNYWSSDSE